MKTPIHLNTFLDHLYALMKFVAQRLRDRLLITSSKQASVGLSKPFRHASFVGQGEISRFRHARRSPRCVWQIVTLGAAFRQVSILRQSTETGRPRLQSLRVDADTSYPRGIFTTVLALPPSHEIRNDPQLRRPSHLVRSSAPVPFSVPAM
jgi:hypothetical protein